VLGGTLATLVSFFNPDRLVLGGGIARASAHVLPAIREAVRARALPQATEGLRIDVSAVEEEVAGVTGAVQLALAELFSRDHLPTWLGSGSPAGRPEVAAAGPGLTA
jgi:predicted NBD/HSP70 family sugar kinase